MERDLHQLSPGLPEPVGYLNGGRIQTVWYPVLPPDQRAANVLGWLTGAAARFRAAGARL